MSNKKQNHRFYFTRSWTMLVAVTLAAVIAHGCEEPSTNNTLKVTSSQQGILTDPMDPEQCDPNNPACAAFDIFPTGAELNDQNSTNLVYDDVLGALTMTFDLTQLLDTDLDGVPDDADDCEGSPEWRSCDNNQRNEGIYVTGYYDVRGDGSTEVEHDISNNTTPKKADVYFVLDGTITILEEIATLALDFFYGNYVNPLNCPDYDPTQSYSGILGVIRCQFADTWVGLGRFREYGDGQEDAQQRSWPYVHILDMHPANTDADEDLIETALMTNHVWSNYSDPDAMTQALYSIASGKGLGWYLPNRSGCPAGRVGYPCFRPDAVKIIVVATDSPVYNGPLGTHLYGTLLNNYGDSTAIPPGVTGPGLTYLLNTNRATAPNLGNLSTKSVTAMGMGEQRSHEERFSATNFNCRIVWRVVVTTPIGLPELLFGDSLSNASDGIRSWNTTG
ncbi:MAG: hypothetical protein R3A47_00180 [Polyangiales bacterium]